MNKKTLYISIIMGMTVILAVLAVVISQKLFLTREEPIAPNVPKSKPKAAELAINPACQIAFNIKIIPTITLTPTPTGTPPPGPTATPTPGPTATPTPGPTSAPPSCGSDCDTNNNTCPSDAPYCVDYSTDAPKGPVCGRQALASEGPQCEQPTPTPINMPAAGIVENTVFAVFGAAAFILMGLLFL